MKFGVHAAIRKSNYKIGTGCGFRESWERIGFSGEMGVAGGELPGVMGALSGEAGRIPTRRKSICRISHLNVLALAISFLVNTVWGFCFYMLPNRNCFRWGRNLIG